MVGTIGREVDGGDDQPDAIVLGALRPIANAARNGGEPPCSRSAPGGNRTRGLRLESATSVSRDVRDVAAFRAIGLLPMPFAMQFGAALIE